MGAHHVRVHTKTAQCRTNTHSYTVGWRGARQLRELPQLAVCHWQGCDSRGTGPRSQLVHQQRIGGNREVHVLHNISRKVMQPGQPRESHKRNWERSGRVGDLVRRLHPAKLPMLPQGYPRDISRPKACKRSCPPSPGKGSKQLVISWSRHSRVR